MNSRAFVLIFILLTVANSCKARLPITILYESLCPDSIRFIQNQLDPSFDSLKGYVDILYVPFGKSSSVNNGEYFTCQHGPAECEGNLIQACVLNELKGNDVSQKEFVVCQMTPGIDFSGQSCAEKVGVSYSKVQNCISSNLGTQLQLEAEVITKNVLPKFVPTIIYNNKFDQRLQDRSLSAFKKVVCEQIGNIAPSC